MMTRLLTICGLAAALLCGCSKNATTGAGDAQPDAAAATMPPPAVVHLAPGQYALAFDQTRDLLRDLGFMLDRVDAQLGVISTHPKGSGGMFTPWDREQSSLADEMEDALQRDRRVVRIEFAPAGVEPGAAGTVEIVDLRKEQRPIDVVFSATIERLYQPGWRVNTQAILDSSYTHDPQLDARGMAIYAVPLRQDADLAAWIADQVRRRVERQNAMK